LISAKYRHILDVMKTRHAMPSEGARDICKKLQALLDQSGYSIKTFATLLGVSASQLDAWLAGAVIPSGPTAKLIKLALEWPGVFAWLECEYEIERGEKPEKKRLGGRGRPRTRGQLSEDRHLQP
jgi:DNA-binding transcriptional regulator YiaG